MKEKIGIIGAGPAGAMAAIMASSKDREVSLIEKNNKLGKKLYITGKGRCNVTNSIDIGDFIDYVVRNKNFLYSSLYSFTNDNLIELLNSNGLETKIERGGRVFPKSNKSSDVIKVLENKLKQENVKLLFGRSVRDIVLQDGAFKVFTNNGHLEFDKIILASGGASYPATGSTGELFDVCKKLGHKVIETRPALVPIEIKNNFIKELQGLSLRNIELKTFYKGKEIFKEFGEMIFTHFGISGPIVLSTSSYINRYNPESLNFEIDLKPALTSEKLDNRVIRDFEAYNNKDFKNSLFDLLPRKIIPVVIEESNIDPNKTVHQITKDERRRLVKTIKGLNLEIESLRSMKEAIITSGGVDTNEINPSTMESNLVDGLFFAGEIIDVDALTGGFNLQIAFSTGVLAGRNI